MGIPDLESVVTVKRVIRELVQGQESTTQLKVLLQEHSGVDGSLSVDELVAKILRSFTESLSVLTSSSEVATGGEVSQNLAISGENGSCNGCGFEDFGESGKRSLPVPIKDRRGCYKRRKNAQACTVVSSKPDDNYAWRKYGQKEILNSKFPRSYFRCTRKYDQGCRATKQVQRIQESPEMYQTTYIGSHTCINMVKTPQLIIDSTTAWEPFLINQPEPEASKVTYEQEYPFISSIIKEEYPKEETTPIIKEKYPKEETLSDVTDNLETSLWSDLKDFEPAVVLSSKIVSDNADTVYSCTGSHSHSTLEMGFGEDSVFDSDRDFHFDENRLFN